jgi:RNA polymerase sigma-70 factor (ECF subfamily)
MADDSHAPVAPGPAFRSLFEAELPYVVRTLRRLGAAERDVEDLAQEVFVAVHRRFAEYDPVRPPRPWLFAFAYRVASNHRRLARHRVEHPDADAGGRASDPGPGPHEQRESRELLLRALERLPLERRTVLVMHDLDGFTAPVIAETLSVPVNTVYARLRIARQELERAVRALTGGRP